MSVVAGAAAGITDFEASVEMGAICCREIRMGGVRSWEHANLQLLPNARYCPPVTVEERNLSTVV